MSTHPRDDFQGTFLTIRQQTLREKDQRAKQSILYFQLSDKIDASHYHIPWNLMS